MPTSIQLYFIALQNEAWEALPQGIADRLELHLGGAGNFLDLNLEEGDPLEIIHGYDNHGL